MSKQVIGIGTSANDGTGDPLRTAFTKSNDNFTEVYNRLITSSSAPTVNDDTGDGYAVGALWYNTTTGILYILRDATLAAAVWHSVENRQYPYVSGNWYPSILGTVGTGSVVTADTIKLATFVPRARVTISALAGRVVATGTTAQFAIFATSSAGIPTGAALAYTATIGTTIAGNITANLTANVTLEANVTYAFGASSDNSLMTLQSIVGAFNSQAFHTGSATLSNITTANASAAFGYTANNTFASGINTITLVPGSNVSEEAFVRVMGHFKVA